MRFARSGLGVSRREAVRIRAKDKSVDPSTVQSNITRGFGIRAEELDKRLIKVLSRVRTEGERGSKQ